MSSHHEEWNGHLVSKIESNPTTPILNTPPPTWIDPGVLKRAGRISFTRGASKFMLEIAKPNRCWSCLIHFPGTIHALCQLRSRFNIAYVLSSPVWLVQSPHRQVYIFSQWSWTVYTLPVKKKKNNNFFPSNTFFWLGRVIFRALFSKFHPLQDGAPVVSKLVYHYVFYQSCIILLISHNVGKITMNHPQNHHFLRWYVYHSQMVCLWHCFTPSISWIVITS